MLGGGRVPARHDGMAVTMEGDALVLLRNHELVVGDPIIGKKLPVYDDILFPVPEEPTVIRTMAGGVSSVQIENGRYAGTQPLLAGTAQNCAGGITPWGSWLTCEESMLRLGEIGGKDHGFVFEVPEHKRYRPDRLLIWGCSGMRQLPSILRQVSSISPKMAVHLAFTDSCPVIADQGLEPWNEVVRCRC